MHFHLAMKFPPNIFSSGQLTQVLFLVLLHYTCSEWMHASPSRTNDQPNICLYPNKLHAFNQNSIFLRLFGLKYNLNFVVLLQFICIECRIRRAQWNVHMRRASDQWNTRIRKREKKNNDNTNHIQLRIEYKNKNVWIVNGRRMQMG